MEQNNKERYRTSLFAEIARQRSEKNNTSFVFDASHKPVSRGDKSLPNISTRSIMSAEQETGVQNGLSAEKPILSSTNQRANQTADVLLKPSDKEKLEDKAEAKAELEDGAKFENCSNISNTTNKDTVFELGGETLHTGCKDDRENEEIDENDISDPESGSGSRASLVKPVINCDSVSVVGSMTSSVLDVALWHIADENNHANDDELEDREPAEIDVDPLYEKQTADDREELGVSKEEITDKKELKAVATTSHEFENEVSPDTGETTDKLQSVVKQTDPAPELNIDSTNKKLTGGKFQKLKTVSATLEKKKTRSLKSAPSGGKKTAHPPSTTRPATSRNVRTTTRKIIKANESRKALASIPKEGGDKQKTRKTNDESATKEMKDTAEETAELVEAETQSTQSEGITMSRAEPDVTSETADPTSPSKDRVKPTTPQSVEDPPSSNECETANKLVSQKEPTKIKKKPSSFKDGVRKVKTTPANLAGLIANKSSAQQKVKVMDVASGLVGEKENIKGDKSQLSKQKAANQSNRSDQEKTTTGGKNEKPAKSQGLKAATKKTVLNNTFTTKKDPNPDTTKKISKVESTEILSAATKSKKEKTSFMKKGDKSVTTEQGPMKAEDQKLLVENEVSPDDTQHKSKPTVHLHVPDTEPSELKQDDVEKGAASHQDSLFPSNTDLNLKNQGQFDRRKSRSDDRKKEPIKMMSNHGSTLKGIIPYLPMPAAVLCLILNIFLPGLGTMLSGFCVLCCGRPRVKSKDGQISMTVWMNLMVGIAQLTTITFMLVGWFWSFVWGIYMVILAKKYATLPPELSEAPEVKVSYNP